MLLLIIPIIMIVLIYISISYLIFKRKLNIKDKRLYLFSKNRSKLFLSLEILAIILFVIISIIYINRLDYIDFTPTFIPKLILLLFLLIQLIQTLELWLFERKVKSYYYQALGTTMLFVVLIFFTLLKII